MNAVLSAETAAATGVASGEAAAVLGVTNGQLGYGLTMKALDEATAVIVFPLLVLSLTSIATGLAAYLATDARASVEMGQVKQAFAEATRQAAAAMARGTAYWRPAA